MNKSVCCFYGLILLACFSMSASHASEDEFADILRDTFSVSEDLQEYDLNQQALLRNRIDSRLREIQNDISMAVVSGLIKPAQEAQLQANLESLKTMKFKAISDGSLERAELKSIADELNSLVLNLQDSMSRPARRARSAAEISPLYDRKLRVNQDGFIESASSFKQELRKKEEEIDNAILNGSKHGALSLRDAFLFRDELKKIGIADLCRSGKRIRYREALLALRKLDRLTERIDLSLRPAFFNEEPKAGTIERRADSFAERQKQIKHKIDQGMLSGKLTRLEGHKLLAESLRISKQEKEKRASKNFLNQKEEEELFMQLEGLNRQLKKELNDQETQ